MHVERKKVQLAEALPLHRFTIPSQTSEGQPVRLAVINCAQPTLPILLYLGNQSSNGNDWSVSSTWACLRIGISRKPCLLPAAVRAALIACLHSGCAPGHLGAALSLPKPCHRSFKKLEYCDTSYTPHKFDFWRVTGQSSGQLI